MLSIEGSILTLHNGNLLQHGTNKGPNIHRSLSWGRRDLAIHVRQVDVTAPLVELLYLQLPVRRGRGSSHYRLQKPEEVILGVPNLYASTCKGCPSACGILVKTREGRPVKVDGNPDHPVNKGKLCTKGQASVINLYDPTRLKEPMFSPVRKDHTQISWDEAYKNISAALVTAAGSGKEIAIIANTITSPTAKKVIDDFKAAYPAAKVYSYELFNNNARRNAWFKS